MSAAEKLKAHGGHIELTAFVGNPSTTIDITFWPQIVAVVSEAERQVRESHEDDVDLELAAALDHLDKVLS